MSFSVRWSVFWTFRVLFSEFQWYWTGKSDSEQMMFIDISIHLVIVNQQQKRGTSWEKEGKWENERQEKTEWNEYRHDDGRSRASLLTIF